MACKTPLKFFPVLSSPALVDGALKGKVALITGGGTGLGKGIATTFAALGAQVAIVARRTDVLQQAAEEIRQKTGGVCEPFKMDVKDPAIIKGAVDEIEAKFGKTPNILVNNAAGNFIMATERLSDNAVSAVIDIVLKGTMRVTREVGQRCIKNGTGCAVLSISTPYARAGGAFVVPSAVSKAGVENMSRSLATDWGKYGLRFNVIAPGPFPTRGAIERLSAMSFEEALEALSKTIPEGRVGQIEELGNLAAFMCSDYASFMNGAIVDFDGGQQHHCHGSGFGPELHKLSHDDWQKVEDTIRGRTQKKQ